MIQVTESGYIPIDENLDYFYVENEFGDVAVFNCYEDAELHFLHLLKLNHMPELYVRNKTDFYRYESLRSWFSLIC